MRDPRDSVGKQRKIFTGCRIRSSRSRGSVTNPTLGFMISGMIAIGAATSGTARALNYGETYASSAAETGSKLFSRGSLRWITQ